MFLQGLKDVGMFKGTKRISKEKGQGERETERQRAGSCLPAESSAATDRAESPAAMFTQECDYPCNHPTIQPVNLRAAGYLVTISYCVGVFTLGANAKFITVSLCTAKKIRIMYF